jgi:glycosyltransferase involved in cell wall biosynthesis
LRKEHTVEIRTFRTFNRFRFKLIKSLAWIAFAPFLVVGRGYDVIYCDDSFPYYAGLVKLVCPRARVIKRLGDLHLMYYFSGWVYRFFHWFERWEWYFCDRILPVSDAMRRYIWDDGDLNVWAASRVVLDPVDMEKFKPKPSEQFVDVMFHGTLGKNKGIEMVVDAATRLPTVKFVVVGAPIPKQYVVPNLTFLGWIPFEGIQHVLARTRIGLALRAPNPGNEFVYTQPYLQYAAMGIPVLVSEREVFKDYFWRFKNVDEMVEQIKLLLDNDDLREDIGAYCLSLVKKHDAKLVAEQLVECCLE